MSVEPLYGLRLRTPRLELRLGSHDELIALAYVAEDGIHPPEEMPFGVPWSDGIGKPGFVDEFVAFHEAQLAGWSLDEWHLNLLVWAEGQLAGTQAVGAERFAETGVARTGSWLGARVQRRGYGTEMRAAVLELAFRELGAVAAESSWIEGNRSSARVSEKLGYHEIEVSEIAPRGVSVPHHKVQVDRDSWHCPVPVEISGLEACLPLFGLTV